MSNNPIKPAVRTQKSQFQDSEDDRIPWKEEGKMDTRFYNLNKYPAKSWDTTGVHCYGDAELDMLDSETRKKGK